VKIKKKVNPAALYVVWALVRPAMKWQVVCEPKMRPFAVLVIQEQWKLGHLARLKPAPVSKAALGG
jgi:hypothetical protein